MKATFELEAIELELHGGPVAGVDEAGRGPLAGPVVAAAVVLDPDNIPDGIADSKALDAEQRRRIYQHILAVARVGIGVADVVRIDADNILNAALWAMAQAVARLDCAPKLVLIDGNKAPPLDFRHPHHRAGRRQVPVDRGRLDRRQGGARRHDDRAGPLLSRTTASTATRATARPSIRPPSQRYGVTPHHRRSFRPVQLALGLL